MMNNSQGASSFFSGPSTLLGRPHPLLHNLSDTTVSFQGVRSPVRSRNASTRALKCSVSVSMPLTLNEDWQESQNLGNRTISLTTLLTMSYEDGLSGGSGRRASTGPRRAARRCRGPGFRLGRVLPSGAVHSPRRAPGPSRAPPVPASEGASTRAEGHSWHGLLETWEEHQAPFAGPVEVGECYVGGLERNEHTSKKANLGRGPVGKAGVVGAKTAQRRATDKRKLSMWPRSDAWARALRPSGRGTLAACGTIHPAIIPRHPGLVDHYAEALTAPQDDPQNRRSTYNINKERTEAVSDSDRPVVVHLHY